MKRGGKREQVSFHSILHEFKNESVFTFLVLGKLSDPPPVGVFEKIFSFKGEITQA
jgi:hypothetical protein